MEERADALWTIEISSIAVLVMIFIKAVVKESAAIISNNTSSLVEAISGEVSVQTERRTGSIPV